MLATMLLSVGLLGGCPGAGGKVAPTRPGQSARELSAAAAVLDRVGPSVALVEVTLLGEGGWQVRSAAGFVLTADGKLVCAAAPLAMSLAGGEAYARTVRAVFHPGLPEEAGYACEVLRENGDAGLALLQIARRDLTPVTLGGEAAVETPVFLIAAPLGLRALAAHAGAVTASDGQAVTHSAGAEVAGGGPLLDGEGRLVGLSLAGGADGQARAVPVARIAAWLESPPEDEPPGGAGVTLRGLLEEAELIFSAQGEEFALPYDNDVTVVAGQRDGVIVLRAAVGQLAEGRALAALHFTYDDPYGALALDDDGALTWVARLPLRFATADYLKTVAAVGARRAEAWAETPAAGELPDATDLYPGGDADALLARLQEVVSASGLGFERSGTVTFATRFGDAPPLRVTVYRGVAYVYAYSGGMPGTGEAEQERIARELLGRNGRDPLGRLALDEDGDLTWEAQVPMSYLTGEYLTLLARTGTQQVVELIEQYGSVPFNETN